MSVDDVLDSAGLPEVSVRTAEALDRTVRRGREHARHRRRFGGAAAAIVIGGLVGGLLSITGDDDPDHVVAGPTADQSTSGSSPAEPDAAQPIGPTAEPEAGDPAVWFVDPSESPTTDRSAFRAQVSRLGCNSGVTGDVLRPGVVITVDEVNITFNVAHEPDGGTCPSNDLVDYEVDLGEAIGQRVLVDGACTPGAAAETKSHCSEDNGVRWRPGGSTSGSELIDFAVPGGPTLAPGEAEGAQGVVRRFLDRLRADDLARAAELWTGYPETLPEEREEIVALLARFRDEHDWLVDDPAPTVFVSPSTGFEDAAPVVTLVADGPNGRPRATAFVTGRADDGAPSIVRLPSPSDRAAPAEGSTVERGQSITLAAFPVEGGVRVFVNGSEVPSTLDLRTNTLTIEIPTETAGDVALTVCVATPEEPAAYAIWYALSP